MLHILLGLDCGCVPVLELKKKKNTLGDFKVIRINILCEFGFLHVFLLTKQRLLSWH